MSEVSPFWLEGGGGRRYFGLKRNPCSRDPVLEGRGILRGDSDAHSAVRETSVCRGTWLEWRINPEYLMHVNV